MEQKISSTPSSAPSSSTPSPSSSSSFVIIQKAASHSMPVITRSSYQRRSSWWDSELRCMQIVVQNKRAIFSREKNLITRQFLYEEFKSFRNQYVRMIRRKKFQKWKEFLEEAHTNKTWGNTFKLLKYKINPKPLALPIFEDFPLQEHPKVLKSLVDSLFPSSLTTNTNLTIAQNTQTVNSINISEVYIQTLIKSSNSKKAPGSDNITNSMLKKIVSLISEPLAKIFKKCLKIGYFPTQTITLKYNHNSYSKTMTKGCPQGSPLSPLLWNILINRLLKTFNIDNASIIAYADDITIVCANTNIDALQHTIHRSLAFIDSWSKENNLKINFKKTNILNFHKLDFPSPIIIDENRIEIVSHAKILGVTFENHHLKSKINFTTHVNSVINKTIIIKNTLNTFCKNTFGIDAKKRKNLYKGMIRPIMSYGSEIWYDQITKRQIKKLESLEHQILRNSIMAFKTVSKACTNSLAKVETLDTFIQAKKMKFLHKNQIQTINTTDIESFIKEFKANKLNENLELTNETFRQFFTTRIPNYIHTNYYTTQFFTGHGPFNEFLNRIKITNTPTCQCNNASLQNPTHLLLECSKYARIKRKLKLDNTSQLSSFVNSSENFKQFKKLCKYIHDDLRQNSQSLA
ncbi:Putative protein in type-1 R1DM retrotransposable element [Sarcoptes scabiei]|uniref:Reverse transcriptase domain-containing protein n=1 Tax=Sarcoptes scabiei TaxID=52283 RepID=A0A834VE58_SARSC|nr:Putative protein in type-1 R1DM retrotransposable element [Sarcoptes scabiei]